MLQRLQAESQRAGHEQRQARSPFSALNAEELGHAQAGAPTKHADHKICQAECSRAG